MTWTLQQNKRNIIFATGDGIVDEANNRLQVMEIIL
jgi:hypothetical protein